MLAARHRLIGRRISRNSFRGGGWAKTFEKRKGGGAKPPPLPPPLSLDTQLPLWA